MNCNHVLKCSIKLENIVYGHNSRKDTVGPRLKWICECQKHPLLLLQLLLWALIMALFQFRLVQTSATSSQRTSNKQSVVFQYLSEMYFVSSTVNVYPQIPAELLLEENKTFKRWYSQGVFLMNFN